MSDGSFYHLDIVDTSGDKKYLDVLTSFIKDSNVIIIMYDITNKDSFKGLSTFNEVIKNYWDKNKKVILLGNKSDLEKERKVSFEEGKYLAKLNNFIFMEVSCLENRNIKETMEIAISIGVTGKNNPYLKKIHLRPKK